MRTATILVGILAMFALLAFEIDNTNDRRQPSTVVTGAFGRDDSGKQKVVDVDKQYRALLRDFGRFKAIWKQQPENQKALKRELVRLEKQLTGLKTSVQEKPATSQPENQNPSTTEGGSSGAAKGPVKPSKKRPTEKDVQRYVEALEKTHLRGTPLDSIPLEEKSLKGVSGELIVKVCDLASVELNSLSKSLKQQPVDPVKVEKSIGRLGILLYRMDGQTTNSVPTTRKTLQ